MLPDPAHLQGTQHSSKNLGRPRACNISRKRDLGSGWKLTRQEKGEEETDIGKREAVPGQSG